ncbi:PRC-barrel domain-containing protein [Vreelandella sp. TE19]
MKRTTLAVAIAAICAGMSIHALAQEESASEGDQAAGGSTEQQQTSGAGAQGAQGAQSQTSTEDDSGEMQSGDTDTDSGTDTDTTGGNQGQMSDDQGMDTDDDAMSDDAAGGDSAGQMESEPSPTDNDMNTEDTMADDTAVDDDETSASDGQMGDNEGRTPNAMEDPDNRESDESLAENDTQGGLMSLTISEVEGMTVVNQEGEEIGSVDNVVEHNDSGDLYAIVSIGGFWGFGATDVALALQEINVEDDQLVMQTTYGSDEIESATEEYNEDNYSQVDGDMQVGEVANHPNRNQ